jgi:ABC-type sugar transport system ATPase subunit
MGEEIAVMEAGRVVQRGTPDELYERPRNVYVASKIGSPHMNLFDGRVAEDGQFVVTALGAIPVSHVGLEPNTQVTLGIRPSDVRPAEAAAETGAAAFAAPVTLLEPLGDVTIVSLATKGPPLRVLLPEAGAMGVKRGDSFPVLIPGRNVHLFNPGDGAAIARPH